MKFEMGNVFVSICDRVLRSTGLSNSRNIYWSRYEPKNFGDQITPYLFRKIKNKEPFFCANKENMLVTSVFGAGSIFRHIKTADFAIVWGSGIISREDKFEKPKKILAVRGPLTRERCIEMGIECPEIYGDPAILLPRFYSPRNTTKKYRIGLIPHFINYNIAREAFGKNDAIKIIDVTQPVENVIEDIVECEATLSGSLHGLIVSHAYGVPSSWIEYGEALMGDGTKFHDYFLSFESYQDYDPILINGNTAYEDLLKFAHANEVPDQETLRGPLLGACPFWKEL